MCRPDLTEALSAALPAAGEDLPAVAARLGVQPGEARVAAEQLAGLRPGSPVPVTRSGRLQALRLLAA